MIASLVLAAAASAPLALHSDNPRSFVFRGRSAVVVTSGEHYRAEWIEPKTGAVLRSLEIEHAGGVRTLASPPLAEDLALAVRGR